MDGRGFKGRETVFGRLELRSALPSGWDSPDRIFHLNGFLVLSLCTFRLRYGSGSDSVDRKAKFHYELLQRR